MHGCLPAARRCAAALMVAFFACGTDAQAVLVEKDGDTLRVTGESWQQNDMAVTQVGTTIRVDDDGPRGGSGAAVDPWSGAGCERHHEPATPWRASYPYVTCSATGIARVVVTLQDHPEIWFRAYNGADSSPTDALQVPLTVTVGGRGAYVRGTPAARNTLTALSSASLVGGEQDDVLTGGSSLSGQGGDDELHGGPDPDRLDGGAGADKLFGEGGDDTLVTSPGGADIVDGGGDGDTCAYDRWTLDGVAISLDGLANDGLRTGARAGNFLACERLDGGLGPDLLTGSAGNDELQSGGCCARGETGPRDELRGLAGSDLLVTNSMRTLLDGGADDDRLLPDWGDDEVYGGSGTDIVDYQWAHSDPIIADLDGASGDDGRPSYGEHDTLGTDIENLVGGDGNDVLGGNASANVIDGRRGADEYSGLGGSDTAVLDDFQAVAVDLSAGDGTGLSPYDGSPTDLEFDSIENVQGTAGNDLLIGDSAANALQGWYGDDLIEGGGGADALRGGPGNDAASYADRTSPVRVDLAAGTGGATGEADALESIEDAIGGEGADTILGNAEWNVLEGGRGADTIDGRAGEDELYGDEDIDTIEARDGEPDYVDCGNQGGTLFADALDEVKACASPAAAPPPGPGTQILPPPTPPSPPTRVASTPAAGLRVDRRLPSSVQRSALVRRGLRIRVRCSGNCTVAAVLRAKAWGRPLGRARGALAGNRWMILTLRAKNPPKRLRSVRLELTVTDAQGRKQRSTSVVRVRP